MSWVRTLATASQSIDIGPNAKDIILALIGLLAAYFARQASKQLKNNGGSSALDKLQAGHAKMITQNEDIMEKLDEHGSQIAALQATATHVSVKQETDHPTKERL